LNFGKVIFRIPSPVKKAKINNKDLKLLGISHPELLISIGREANRILKRKTLSKVDILNAIRGMIENPDGKVWENHPLKEISTIIREKYQEKKVEYEEQTNKQNTFLRETPLPYPTYGEHQIEASAIQQMDRAMSLPISIAGALMADAHEGYGLPIGGVLATNEGTVIPYAVGVDIACRMCMSVFPMDPTQNDKVRVKLRNLLYQHTIFGVGTKNKNHIDTSLFDKSEWKATRFIRQHSDLAYSQLGTSGAGNHFVEWGELNVLTDAPEVNLKKGNYIALLSHSGSRGFGNEVANFYSKVAMGKVHLPREARHLAWLDLSSEEGHEYWIAMNLAGEYASANHREIHQKISGGLGLTPTARIENHHNFAWKEKLPNGKISVVHRKGATPAGKGVIGIIPGSMAHPGFIIRGKGNPDSLNSASHGAGRRMSRSQAMKTFSWNELESALEKFGVELIGGDLDESPMAYKNIEDVMKLQQDLVEVIAVFQPRIVRMAEGRRR